MQTHHDTSTSTTMTIRLDVDTKKRLETLAGMTDRSKSWLAAQAVRDYVDVNEWQLGEIKAALAEADAGDFASSVDVANLATRWLADAR